ncbi:unnamed protein product [Choristocarpus tenellus]
MGIFISRLFDIITGLQKRRLIMLGLDAVGKTSILYRLSLGENVTTIPTIGFNVENVQFKKMDMTIWEVGGGEKIPPLWRHYCSDTDALIFVVDSHDRERLDMALGELYRLLRELPMDECHTVLIFLNKQDLPGAVTPSQALEKLAIDNQNPLKHRSWYLQACCAVSGEGIHAGLEWLYQTMKEHPKEVGCIENMEVDYVPPNTSHRQDHSNRNSLGSASPSSPVISTHAEKG